MERRRVSRLFLRSRAMAKATKKPPVHPVPEPAINPRTVAAPRPGGHADEVAQPPGLHSPALEFHGGRYVQPRPQAHHVAWDMDQLPWLGYEGGLDGGPIIPG